MYVNIMVHVHRPTAPERCYGDGNLRLGDVIYVQKSIVCVVMPTA